MKYLRTIVTSVLLALFAFNMPAAKKGDLNNDGSVNVGDVGALYSLILNPPVTYFPAEADLNGDGFINVGDVGALYALILNPEPDEYENEEVWFNSCYETLQSKLQIADYDNTLTSFLRGLIYLNELPTDEFKCCWGDAGMKELNTNSYGSDLPQGLYIWLRLAQNINLCNAYLNSEANHDDMHNAEIRFLRDLYLYYMMDLFGNVPFSTDADLLTEAPMIGRGEAFEFLVNDLAELESSLAEPRANDYRRVDKAAAWLLLSRLYVNAQVYAGTPKYNEAKLWAGKVIDSDYSLLTEGTSQYSAFQMLFMGDNDTNGAEQEIILPIKYDSNDDMSFAYGGTTFIIASIFDNEMLNNYDNGLGQCWSGIRGTDALATHLVSIRGGYTPAEFIRFSGDDRAMLYGVGHTDEIEDLSKFDQGYGYPKFLNLKAKETSGSSGTFADTDFPLMRVAEAYLTYAEADAYLAGGSCSADGLEKFNAVRTRSGATPYRGASIYEVFSERSREFALEGHRRTDLIRAGAFGGTGTEYMTRWAWKGGVAEGTFFDERKNVYAIPSEALKMNPNLSQNAGYDVVFNDLTLTSTPLAVDVTTGESIVANWTEAETDGYLVGGNVEYKFEISFDGNFENSKSAQYYRYTSYQSGDYIEYYQGESNTSEIEVIDINKLVKWYEASHGGNITDAHKFYLRVECNVAGFGKATSNVVEVTVTGVTDVVSVPLWWLTGDCVAAGSWYNETDPVGSEGMVPMLPQGTNTLVYAGYFEAGDQLLIISPDGLGDWNAARIGGGDETGGQSYEANNNNIIISNSGYYKLSLNTQTKELTWTKLNGVTAYESISMPGYHNTWSPASDYMTPMISSRENHNWMASLSFTDSSNNEFKFAANGGWDVNWGSADFPFGTGTQNGQNIPAEQGTYTIYFNDILGTYYCIKR